MIFQKLKVTTDIFFSKCSQCFRKATNGHDLPLCLIYVSAQYLPHFTNVNYCLTFTQNLQIIHSERERKSILQLHHATRHLEVLKLEQMRI